MAYYCKKKEGPVLYLDCQECEEDRKRCPYKISSLKVGIINQGKIIPTKEMLRKIENESEDQ